MYGEFTNGDGGAEDGIGFGGKINNINSSSIGNGGSTSVKRENFYNAKIGAEHLLKRKKPEKKPIEEIDIEC